MAKPHFLDLDRGQYTENRRCLNSTPQDFGPKAPLKDLLSAVNEKTRKASDLLIAPTEQR